MREGETPPCGVIPKLPQSANESYDWLEASEGVLDGRVRQEAPAERGLLQKASASLYNNFQKGEVELKRGAQRS